MVALGSPRMMRFSAGAAAAIIVLSSLACVAVSFEAADRLVHPPRELRSVTPAARGLAFEPIGFDSTDGIPLVGWWMPAQDAVGTVVFLHGYGASKSQALAVAPFLVRHHMNVLAFDFRAHGGSGGTHTTIGLEEAQDVRGAIAYLGSRTDVDNSRIALFGWSMGAAAALNAAPFLPHVRGIVADSSFASMTNVVSNDLGTVTGLPHFPFVPLIVAFASQMTHHGPDENSPEREAAILGRPLLVIQGLDDGIARPDGDGAALASAAGAWADLWLVPGAGHVDARRAQPGEYEARVTAFLEAALR